VALISDDDRRLAESSNARAYIAARSLLDFATAEQPAPE
jgi:hypothetical protein